MAARGPKSAPTHLKIVRGNPGKRTLPTNEPEATGDLVRPKYLRGRALALWKEASASCYWLGECDSYKLGMWCALQAEFERGPKAMIAGRIAQLRALGSELGMDPASRTRLEKPHGKKKDPAEKYF